MNTNTISYAESDSDDERSTVVSAGSDCEVGECVSLCSELAERCRAGASPEKSSTSGCGGCGHRAPTPSPRRQTNTLQNKPTDCECHREKADLCETQRLICETRKRLSKQLNCEVDDCGNCRRGGQEQKSCEKKTCGEKSDEINKRSFSSKPGSSSDHQVKEQIRKIQEELCKLDKRRLQLLRCLEHHQNTSIEKSFEKVRRQSHDNSCERPRQQSRNPCCGGPPKPQQQTRDKSCERPAQRPKPCPTQQPKPCLKSPTSTTCSFNDNQETPKKQKKCQNRSQSSLCNSMTSVNDESCRREPDHNNCTGSRSKISLTAGGSYDRLDCLCKNTTKCGEKPCEPSTPKCGQPKCESSTPKCGQPKCESSAPKCGKPKCESSTPKCGQSKCESSTPKCEPRCGASSEPKPRASDNCNTTTGSCVPPKTKGFDCNCKVGR